VKSKSIVSPNSSKPPPQNKKPAGVYRASGPMSANFDALLKPPRTRSNAVMMVMPMVSRGEIHGGKEYTGAGYSRQEKQSRSDES
jgi:hypothetical protein